MLFIVLGLISTAWAGRLILSNTVNAASVPEGVAYVANSTSDSVSVVDTHTNQVITTIQVGDFPTGVVVTPDG